MRTALLLLLLDGLVLSACSSTRVVEATWDEETVAMLNVDSGRVREVETVESKTITVDTDFSASMTSLNFRSMTRVVTPGTDSRAAQSTRFVVDEQFSPEEIRSVRLVRRRKGRGLLFGMLYGAAGGALLGAVAYKEPDCDDQYFCLDPRSRAESTVLGGIGGALAGMLWGGLIGSKETTVYRFGDSGDLTVGRDGLSYRLRIGR